MRFEGAPEKRLSISLLGTGSSLHIQRLAAGLAERGHVVSIITASQYGPYPQIGGVHFYTFDSSSPVHLRLLAIRRLLKKIAPDVLHSHFVNYGGFIGLSLGYHPHLISAWGCDVLNYPESSYAALLKTKVTLRAADWLLPVSKQLQSEIARISNTRAHNDVLSWGVQMDHFAPSDAGLAFRKKWGLAMNDPLVLSPRVLEPLYNQLSLLKAWPAIKESHPRARLLILRFGVDPLYEAALHREAKRLAIEDDLIWLESVSYADLPSLYLAADVVVSIALSDGTPMTVLEAMACGRPVVVSSLPSLRDWVSDGENGRVVDPQNIIGLSQAISSLLEASPEDKASIQKNNRETIMLRADHDRCLIEFERIYLRVAGRSGFNWGRTFKNILGISP